MVEEYTPTTDEVRAAWQVQTRRSGAERAAKIAEAEAAFDRWLAAHDAQVKAEAWDEAVEAAARHGSRWFANPYRAAETEATR